MLELLSLLSLSLVYNFYSQKSRESGQWCPNNFGLYILLLVFLTLISKGSNISYRAFTHHRPKLRLELVTSVMSFSLCS